MVQKYAGDGCRSNNNLVFCRCCQTLSSLAQNGGVSYLVMFGLPTTCTSRHLSASSATSTVVGNPCMCLSSPELTHGLASKSNVHRQPNSDKADVPFASRAQEEYKRYLIVLTKSSCRCLQVVEGREGLKYPFRKGGERVALQCPYGVEGTRAEAAR